ncbi:hypothetical protein CQW23_10606 [Capsicum baccatum]|uniref:Cyclin-like domain-containing protein n=1 Tax=Capsicum baccatum TaxID=33114 RepID=A0A2G2X0A6_CAPBA|nr:hypothetical protein CQW23_10606 [Capsicum baccatum]
MESSSSSSEEEEQEVQQENGSGDDNNDDDANEMNHIQEEQEEVQQEYSGGDDNYDDDTNEMNHIQEEQGEVQQEYGGGDDNNDDDANEMNQIQFLIDEELDNFGLNDHDNPGPNDHQDADIMDDIWEQDVRHRAVLYIVSVSNQQPNISIFLIKFIRQLLQFRVETLYSAVLYVDRFLLEHIIAVGQNREVRLLSVTCLSLAAQVVEGIENVPPLAHYPLGNFVITVDQIREFELLVRGDLNGHMHYVIPFDFIRFFVPRFCRDVPSIDYTRMRIDEVIMSALRDVRIMNHRPSVIAAAATLLAVNRNLTIEQVRIEINALPYNGLILVIDPTGIILMAGWQQQLALPGIQLQTLVTHWCHVRGVVLAKVSRNSSKMIWKRAAELRTATKT